MKAPTRVIAIATSLAIVSISTVVDAASREEVLDVLQQVVSPTADDGTGLKVWANDGKNLPFEEGSPILRAQPHFVMPGQVGAKLLEGHAPHAQ